MSDLPYNAVRVEMDGMLAEFIGAHGEILGMRVMGLPRIWRCTACGCRCEVSTLSDRIPECYKHDPRADFSPINNTQEDRNNG